MPAPAIVALTAALAAVAALARPRYAFAAVVAATVLFPDTLALPTAVSPILTIHLVVTVAALGGLAWRTAEGLIPASVWRPTGASIGLAAYLVVALLVGIAAAAPDVSVSAQLTRAVDLVQQLLVLIVCTGLVREDGRTRAFVAPFAAVLLASAGIGILEHVTGGSWGHYLFSHLPSQSQTPAAAPLQLRDGAVRARGGADFALSYAAVLVAMLSVLTVAAVRARGIRRLLWLGGGAVVLLAIYWSGTRSVLVAFLVMIVLLAVFSRDRRVILAVGAAVVVTLAGFAVVTAVAQHFSVSVDAGSVAVREQRLPIVLQAVSARPFTGLGLSGLSALGVKAVDSSYLLVYGETGALGLAALIGALVAAFASVARGLWTRDRDQRLLIAAVIAGMFSIVVSAVALDAIDLPSVINVFWELAAIGLVAADQALRPARLVRRSVVLLAGVVSAAAIGGAAAVAAPNHVAQSYSFQTLNPITDVGSGDLVITGNQLIASVCGTFQAAEPQLRPGVVISCRNPYTASGEGELRIQVPNRSYLKPTLATLGKVLARSGLHLFGVRPTTPLQTGRPSGLLTLPAALPVGLLIALLGVPLNRRERSAGPWPPAPSRRRAARRSRPSRTPPLAPAQPT